MKKLKEYECKKTHLFCGRGLGQELSVFTCTVKSRDGYSSPRAKISMHNLTVTVCAQNSALKSLKATNANIYEKTTMTSS